MSEVVENAYKSAFTDARKRALRMFGAALGSNLNSDLVQDARNVKDVTTKHKQYVEAEHAAGAEGGGAASRHLAPPALPRPAQHGPPIGGPPVSGYHAQPAASARPHAPAPPVLFVLAPRPPTVPPPALGDEEADMMAAMLAASQEEREKAAQKGAGEKRGRQEEGDGEGGAAQRARGGPEMGARGGGPSRPTPPTQGSAGCASAWVPPPAVQPWRVGGGAVASASGPPAAQPAPASFRPAQPALSHSTAAGNAVPPWQTGGGVGGVGGSYSLPPSLKAASQPLSAEDMPRL